MNKTILMFFGLCGVITMGTLLATSELRSPLGRFGDVWFDYRYMFDPTDADGWQVDLQAVGYARCSTRSFGFDETCKKSCDNNKVTSNTVSLSTLFFNKTPFKVKDIFACSNLNGRISNAPGLTISELRPHIWYEEQGVTIGLHAYRELSTRKNMRIGGRIGLPIKRIAVKNEGSDALLQTDNNGNAPFDAVITCRQEQTTEDISAITEVCAYRLDFLSSLLLPNGTPLIQYGDGTAANPTKVANILADSSIFSITPPLAGFTNVCVINPSAGTGPNSTVYLMRESTSAMPYMPIDPASENTQNTGSLNNTFILRNVCAADLPAGGNVGADDDRYRFLTTNNYAANLANDPEEQAKWFLIPVTGEGVNSINTISQEMFNVISYVVQQQMLNGSIAESATTFLLNKGIDLGASQAVMGVGDLELQLYAGNYWDASYINGFIGFRLPTGRENDNQKKVYFQPTGHNGHFELMIGVDGGVHPNNWFAFTADIAYHHVCKHTERRAAPFIGATVRNIGPAIDADVSWGWAQANAVVTFFNPKDSDLGCTLGYEFYAKRKDSVALCAKTATDFLGSDFALDKKLLEKDTNSQTHKARGTIFYKIGYGEFMFGASYIFAGKHAMKESEWHIGMNISF